MYRAFVTGEDLEYLLRRFNRRESLEDFEQACRIAQQITPSITSALMSPPKKVVSVRPVVDRIDYGKENDRRADELRDELAMFYGGNSMDHYLNTLVEPSDIDPNAFVLLTFDPFDYRSEKPTVYPVFVPSANVWGHSYLSGILEWLWLGFDIKYVTKAGYVDALGREHPAETADGLRMALYTHDHHIVFEQVEKNTVKLRKSDAIVDEMGVPVQNPSASDGRTEVVYYFKPNDDTLYTVRFYEQDSGGRVPAFRVGCKADQHTGGETCVNRWHEAVPHLKKNLQHVRELDLSIALHTFPQKIQYVSKCKSHGCTGGTLPDGGECGSCKGSGFTTINSAQDHITMPLPKDPSEMIDPTKIIHYAPVPIDIVTKLMEIVKEDRSDAFRSVYGSDLYGQGNVGKTYEEVIAQNQALYDSLQPFARWWAESRKTITYVYAAYRDMDEGLEVVYRLPRAFGFETTATLYDMMKGARDAGASKAILANLNDTVLDLVFRDDAQKLAKARTQAKFDPFPGLAEATILSLIAGGKASERSALMWTESATVFTKAEAKYPGEMSFYDLAEPKQRQVIDEILDEMLEENKPQPV